MSRRKYRILVIAFKENVITQLFLPTFGCKSNLENASEAIIVRMVAIWHWKKTGLEMQEQMHDDGCIFFWFINLKLALFHGPFYIQLYAAVSETQQAIVVDIISGHL